VRHGNFCDSASLSPQFPSQFLQAEVATASPRTQAKSSHLAATKQRDGQISQNPVRPFPKKYSASAVGQISGLVWRVSPDERGGSRSSRTRGGMRWTRKLRLTSVADADGEVVWSWRPDAGVKSCGAIRMATVARKPVHRGEREVSRKTIAQGRPDCLR
jgi:hypothetical protein